MRQEMHAAFEICDRREFNFLWTAQPFRDAITLRRSWHIVCERREASLGTLPPADIRPLGNPPCSLSATAAEDWLKQPICAQGAPSLKLSAVT